ncbi:MAG: DNA polymerase III subunit gamma/tau [Alistipes finegoldii]
MSDFIVSARKYRPATFASVVGQKHITSTLKNAIERAQLAHAYLFCGPRGVGKTTCARIFAKAINCLSPNGAEACNECESCRSFNEGRSLNIHELDAASNNSVEDIRTLIEQVRIIPQVGRYSVFIIDEVHMLSAAAFNAFLKTLEEPPAHAIFILATTEKHKIIPTILSRCQIYDFNRIRVEDSVEYLKYIAGQENISADEESLNLIAQKADGGMRDALSMFDKAVSFCGTTLDYRNVAQTLNVLDYDTYFSVTEMLLARQLRRCAGHVRHGALERLFGADLHGGTQPPHARPADGQAPRNAAADRNDRNAARTIPDAGGRLQCRVPVRSHLHSDGDSTGRSGNRRTSDCSSSWA